MEPLGEAECPAPPPGLLLDSGPHPPVHPPTHPLGTQGGAFTLCLSPGGLSFCF